MPLEKLGERADRRPRAPSRVGDTNPGGRGMAPSCWGSPPGTFEILNLIWCPLVQSEASLIQKATRLFYAKKLSSMTFARIKKQNLPPTCTGDLVTTSH